jgi:signal transduction histidine kinase/CheY-like chemotaxis protein
MPTPAETHNERILVLAPLGRDGSAAAQQFAEAGLTCEICSTLEDLSERLDHGAGVALIAEEAFHRVSNESINTWVAHQPPWSDFPFIVLTTRHSSVHAHAYRLRLLESLGNVSLLERPIEPVTLVSAVRAALRARRRQYEVRDYLLERTQSAARLEQLVQHRTQQLMDSNRLLRSEIAERRSAQTALLHAQKVELMGQMTGGIAHDFNNLLTAVLGNLELATHRIGDEKIRRFLNSATQAAQRGAKLTAQLLAFARKQRLQSEPTDVNALVSGLGDLLFRTIGATIRIETVLEKDLWPAMIDAGQVESIIVNLAINARDAMPEGGRLTISTANAGKDDQRRPHDLAAGEYVVVSVRDTGIGMTDEVLSRVFEPFFTTKPVGKGTGLGLSQVHGITTQLRGGVRIDTQVGKGTTIAVYLPRAERGAVQQHSHASATIAQSQEAGCATILVVDDDRDVRDLAVACLEGNGYRVIAADGLDTAMEIVGKPWSIDLLLIDSAMPEVKGIDVARAILAERPKLPVLFMTGYAGVAAAEHTPQKNILAKPFTVTEMAAKVEDALHAAGGPISASSNVVPMKPGFRR